jgi:hypothetical protein
MRHSEHKFKNPEFICLVVLPRVRPVTLVSRPISVGIVPVRVLAAIYEVVGKGVRATR